MARRFWSSITSLRGVAALCLLAAWFLVVPLQAQVRTVQTIIRQVVWATSHYILGSADTSGVRLDVESGFLACREGDDSAYCDGVRALIYQARRDGIGTTYAAGVELINNTAAAAGAQQHAPGISATFQGWKTDATAASQTIICREQWRAVQGTSAPSAQRVTECSINGGAFSTVATLFSNGTFSANFLTSNTDHQTSATGRFLFSTRGQFSAPADGQYQFANWAADNTFRVTLADWGTKLSAEGVGVANDGLIYLGASQRGMMTIDVVEDNRTEIFWLGGGSNQTAKVSSITSQIGVTKDNAATINVYYDAAGASGAGYYIQNKRGATRTIRAVLIGA